MSHWHLCRKVKAEKRLADTEKSGGRGGEKGLCVCVRVSMCVHVHVREREKVHATV